MTKTKIYSLIFFGGPALLMFVALGLLKDVHFGGTDKKEKALPITQPLAQWLPVSELFDGNLAPPQKANQENRSLAQIKPVCFKDTFTLESAKEEIAELEKLWRHDNVWINPHRLWRNFKLSMMPPPEASFLIEFGEDLVGHQVIGLRCTDLTCILDSIYGKYDAPESIKIYHWYLKTRTVISTLDQTPGYSRVPGLPASEYLFNNGELDGLRKVMKILSPQYQRMNTLASFHRFPRGRTMVNNATSAHLAYSDYTIERELSGNTYYQFDKKPSQILISESDVSETNGQLTGKFYYSVIHELSHSLDFYKGPFQVVMNFSETPEWLDFSWKLAEARLQRGVTRVYKHKPGGEKFFRTNSQVSPQEDFADSMTYFRLEYANAAKRIPKKADWISKKFYDGRTFDTAGLTRFYMQSIHDALKPNLLKIEKECARESASNRISAADCLSERTDQIIEETILSLRRNEMEACPYFDSPQGPALRAAAQAALPGYLESARAEKTHLEQIETDRLQFRAEIKNVCDPREIYLKVRELRDTATVYSERYESCLKQAFQKYPNLIAVPDLERVELTALISANTYWVAMNQTRSSFIKLMTGYVSVSVQNAQARWDSCVAEVEKAGVGTAASPLPEESSGEFGGVPLLTTPFSGGNKFVHAGLLFCINSRLMETIGSEMEAFLGPNLKNHSPEVLSYIAEIALPLYLGVFQTQLIRTFANEWSRLSGPRLNSIKAAAEALEKDMGWLALRRSNSLANDMLQSTCETDYQSLLHQRFVEYAGTKVYLATALHEVWAKWIKDACAAAIKRPVPTEPLPSASVVR